MKSDRKALLVFSLASFAVSFIYYGRYIYNFFSYDDFGYIENILYGPSSILLGYHTLRLVSNVVWWPLYSVSGLDPFIFNLLGIVLHAVNAVLVFLLIFKLIGRKDYAVLGGAFFLLSAAGCDAILWKSTNSTLLCLFFYLLTLTSYVIYRQRGAKAYLAVSVILFLVAMFSKEEAASMPFIVILIELVFFGGTKDKKAVVQRVAPYVAIVLIYILANKLIFGHLLHTSDDPSKFFQFRPLYSLLAGWTVFFISPEGFLNISNPAIYLTALGVVLSFFWVKDRRLLYFGYGWVFLSFLPQSLSNLGQFEPKTIFNSISRYLYITSIGSSVVFAAVIVSFRERVPARFYYIVSVVILSLYVWLNYGRVQARGNEWRETSEPMVSFLDAMKKKMPNFPPNSHVFVLYAPSGRAYLQQALRAFYKRTDIFWIFKPEEYTRRPGESAFFGVYSLNDKGEADLYIIPVNGLRLTEAGDIEPVN